MPDPSAPRASERRVLQVVAEHGALTRAELSAIAGLPLRTVTAATSRLAARGLLTQNRAAPSRRGRSATVFALPAEGRTLGVVIVTHDDITACRLDEKGDRLGPAVREDFRWWACPDLAAEAARLLDGPVDGLVLAIPQAYRQGHGVTLLEDGVPSYYGIEDYPEWIRGDLAARLTERLGVPAVVENLINLAALGESADVQSLLYLRLGDIVASAVVVEGRIVRGALGAAGELGHVHVDPNGKLCACGARGCLGTVANARHLLEVLRPRYGDNLGLFDVVALAAQGEEAVRRVLADLGRTVGAAIAGSLVMINPEALVVDPVLGPATAPVLDGLREAIGRALPTRLRTALTITAGRPQQDAVVTGATTLWKSSDRQRNAAR
ncbi:ROK family protein [Actinoplanes sp. NPDC000266]